MTFSLIHVIFVFVAGVLLSPFIHQGVFAARAWIARHAYENSHLSRFERLGFSFANPRDARKAALEEREQCYQRYSRLLRALSNWRDVVPFWTSTSKLS